MVWKTVFEKILFEVFSTSLWSRFVDVEHLIKLRDSSIENGTHRFEIYLSLLEICGKKLSYFLLLVLIASIKLKWQNTSSEFLIWIIWIMYSFNDQS